MATIAIAAKGWISSIFHLLSGRSSPTTCGVYLNREKCVVETEINDTVSSLGTDELLKTLAAYGVTRDGLKYDCRHGYLPHPTTLTHESGRGRAGRYEPFVVTRAKRLYRLRRLECDPRTIRLLLFLKDGWGWEFIREDCLSGAVTLLGQSLNGLKRFTPKGGVDDIAVEKIAAHQHSALLRKFDDPPPHLRPVTDETTRFIIGTVGTGTPLEGASAKRLVAPIAKTFWPGIGRFQTSILCMAFDMLTALMDLRSERMIERIERATEPQVQRARKSFVYHLRLLRYVFRRRARPRTEGICFSLVTLGGQARKIDPSEFAKSGLSMYQALAAFIGIFLAIDMALDEFIATWRSIMPMLLRSLFGKKTKSSVVQD